MILDLFLKFVLDLKKQIPKYYKFCVLYTDFMQNYFFVEVDENNAINHNN